MKSYFSFHTNYVNTLYRLLADEQVMVEVKNLVLIIKNAHKLGKVVYIAGNGGHSSTATHWAADLNSLGINAVSLASNISELTRIANDFGYEHIFDMQLENVLNKGDVVIGISASGNSKNIVKLMEYANQQRATSVALVGFSKGGLAKEIASTNVHIKTKDGEYGIAEDAHMTLCHIITFYLKQCGVSNGINNQL